MNNKKVLFVAAVNPFIFGGGSQGQHCFLDATLDIFGRKNVDVMLAEESVIPKEYGDINCIFIPRRSKVQRIVQYFEGYLSRFTKPLIKYMKQHSNEYSHCIVNVSQTGGKAIPIINKLNVKTVVIFANYEVEYHKDNKTIESLYGHFLAGIKYVERISYKYANLCLFHSNQDVELFKKAYGETKGICQVLGAYNIKASEKNVDLYGVNKDVDLAISGSLVNYQTTVGIEDFHYNYLDVAKSVIPDLKVLLTGRNPSKGVQDIVNNNPDIYTIVPNPQNIFPVVQRGKIYVCPTCIGGGMKIRAMDGLRCGMPILSHAVSARGYDYYYDKPYYKIYHDKESFKQGLIDLLEFINDNPNVEELINHDYYDYFGYDKGLKRMKDALDMI